MTYLVAIQKHFEGHNNEGQAIDMAAYMKNHFEFLGIKAPERKKLLSSFVRQNGKPDRSSIEDIVIGLWSLPYREYQYCAMELADKVLKKPHDDDILIIEYMLEYKQWWDTVDFIASHLVGRIFKINEGVRLHYFKKWVRSPDMWLNRTAILFQLGYKEHTDTRLLQAAILPHIDSKEFFHQKAIGWALRQYSKTNPDWVKEFLKNNQLAALSIREASKYL